MLRTFIVNSVALNISILITIYQALMSVMAAAQFLGTNQQVMHQKQNRMSTTTTTTVGVAVRAFMTC